jgi:hypothetical protein
MQYAVSVRRAQRSQHAEPDSGYGGHVEWALLRHYLVQRPRLNVLHDDPGRVALDNDVVHGHDVGVAEPRRGPRLAQGPRTHLAQLSLSESGWRHQLLDRGLATEQFVGRQPDPAHAALAYRLLEAVPAGESGLRRGHRRRHTHDGDRVSVPDDAPRPCSA